MCTNEVLRNHIRKYAELQIVLKTIQEDLQTERDFIISEMDNRKTLEFEGKKIITERLQETATKAGKEILKATFTGNEIEKYLTVSLARYINSAAAKKF